MEPVSVARVALPVLLAAFVAVLFVWPVRRLRRETGAQAMVLHRRDAPGQRVGALAFLGVQVGVGVLALAYAIGGPDTVGAVRPGGWLVAAGLLLCLAGLAIVAVAQRQMGPSFRIGIDAERTPLVGRGLFGVVRNPIFSGLLVMLAGVVALAPGVWSVSLWLAALGAIAWQTRLEERHLLALHGEAYRRYAERTGRFVPGVGRLRFAPSTPPAPSSPATGGPP
jgi:protein-S-isoprenylcysteine O-methyltransferase Ste14